MTETANFYEKKNVIVDAHDDSSNGKNYVIINTIRITILKSN